MNDEFVKRIIALKGNKGKKWLDDLPQIIKHYEENWEIRVSPHFISRITMLLQHMLQMESMWY